MSTDDTLVSICLLVREAMHFCADELYILLATLPVIGVVVSWARGVVSRFYSWMTIKP